MNRRELNKQAINIVKVNFQTQGFDIEDDSSSQVDFHAISKNDQLMKIKVRSVSQFGSYVFMPKRKFNIADLELYMAVLYLPFKQSERIMYVVPAAEWGKGVYPFKGKDYDKLGQVSEPEWGITFSRKAKDAMEPYRFLNRIN